MEYRSPQFYGDVPLHVVGRVLARSRNFPALLLASREVRASVTPHEQTVVAARFFESVHEPFAATTTLLWRAARVGNPALVEHYMARPGVVSSTAARNMALIEAARLGHNHICQQIHRRGVTHVNEALCWAAFEGNLQLCRYFIDSTRLSAKELEDALAWAAQGGHMAACDMFEKEGAVDYDRALRKASLGGHVEVVQHFLSAGGRDLVGAVRNAAQGGHGDLCDALVRTKTVQVANVGLEGAALGGHTHLVRHFLGMGATSLQRAYVSAAHAGNMDACEELRRAGANNLDEAFRAARSKGHSELTAHLARVGASNLHNALVDTVNSVRFFLNSVADRD